MKKKIYFVYLIVYIILSLIELFMYLKFNSTTFGFLYMVLNFVFIFLLSFSVYNYNELNLKVRISKNGILLFLLLFSMLLKFFNFNDESLLFIENIKLYINVIKPIMFLILIGLSIYDFKIKDDIVKNIKKKK